MSWHADLSARLDRIEASTQSIKARLVRYLAQETGRTEAEVLAELAREKRRHQAAR